MDQEREFGVFQGGPMDGQAHAFLGLDRILEYHMYFSGDGLVGTEVYELATEPFFLGETVPLRDDQGLIRYRYVGQVWAQPTP